MMKVIRQNPGKASLIAGAMAVMPLSDYGYGQYLRVEGNKLVAYADPATKADPWTICGGGTGRIYYDGKVVTVRKGLVLSEAQCKQVNDHIAEEYRIGLARCISVNLTQSQSDGLVIFAINVGVATACASSVIRNVNKSDFGAAGKALLLYSCAASTNVKYPHAHCGAKRQMPSLLDRRKFEASLLMAKVTLIPRSTADNLAIANAKILEDAK